MSVEGTSEVGMVGASQHELKSWLPFALFAFLIAACGSGETESEQSATAAAPVVTTTSTSTTSSTTTTSTTTTTMLRIGGGIAGSTSACPAVTSSRSSPRVTISSEPGPTGVVGVVQFGGRPKAGCKVVFGQTLEALNRGLDATEQTGEAAITDESGSFAFSDVEPGQYLIAAPGCGLLMSTEWVTVSSGERARVEFSC